MPVCYDAAMDEKPKRKRASGAGRPRKYVGLDGKGAPMLRVRLAPAVHEVVRAAPEGCRAYIERLVRSDGGLPPE